ncbi:MAG: HEAT repeat domain-containing protein [Planctomycetaceae bacterium]|nr:HEAT repeat domain-containing protein [Planctomycetaceae bacterium]
MTPATEKNIRFCIKTDNPAATEMLRFYLKSDDYEIRQKAFEGIFFKQEPGIFAELFRLIRENEEMWMKIPFLTPARLGKILDSIIRGNDWEQTRTACEMAVRYKVYESLPAISTLLEVPKPEYVSLSAETTLQLAECFYESLAAAVSSLELRNMDRQREWIAAQMEVPVRKYGIHGRDEFVRAYLMVAKRGYTFLNGVLDDIHSQVCKLMIKLLRESEGGSYYRLLLSYIGDANTPQIINNVLTEKDNKSFVQYLLKWISDAPSQSMKDALKRFNRFSWIRTDNTGLADLIEGLEACFVQLVAHATLPREITLAMFEFILQSSSVEGKRAVMTVIRSFSGDDVNRILLAVASDSDPVVCSKILKILKNRNVKEAVQVIMQNVEHPDPLVRRTIYELMPEFRIENFLQKMGQISPYTAGIIGKIVLNVDPHVHKRISEDIASATPLRRRVAMETLQCMGICGEYEEQIVHLLENDDEVPVRVAACKALGDVVTQNSVQTLTWASHDRNLMVQRAAVESLEKLHHSLYAQSET